MTMAYWEKARQHRESILLKEGKKIERAVRPGAKCIANWMVGWEAYFKAIESSPNLVWAAVKRVIT